jgi:hypothetical protein
MALGGSELLMGGGAAVLAAVLLGGPAAQEGAPFFLLLLPYMLLVPSGAGIFSFRPWSYRLHLLLTPIALVGGPLWFSTEVGIREMLPQLFAGLVAALVLTRMFFSRSVRRMFGISHPAAGDRGH